MRGMSWIHKLATHQETFDSSYVKQRMMMVGKSKGEAIVLSRLSTIAHVTATQLPCADAMPHGAYIIRAALSRDLSPTIIPG